MYNVHIYCLSVRVFFHVFFFSQPGFFSFFPDGTVSCIFGIQEISGGTFFLIFELGVQRFHFVGLVFGVCEIHISV